MNSHLRIPTCGSRTIGHRRLAEAEHLADEIEARVRASRLGIVLAVPAATLSIDPTREHRLRDVWDAMIRTYPKRTIVAFSLMISQAFLYNPIFFTESPALSTFFGVAPQSVGYYIFPFAVGNLLGPLVLGPLFDRIGRKPMIAMTYGLSAVLLAGTGILFVHGVLDARSIAFCWSVVLFFASAGASSAYLAITSVALLKATWRRFRPSRDPARARRPASRVVSGTPILIG